MPRARRPINGAVLEWAINEAGLSTAEVSTRIGVDPPVVDRWLSGTELPSKGELSRVASLLKRPTAIFFLPSPPPSAVPPSLRRAAGRTERTLKPSEIQEVRRARRTQRLVSVLMRDEHEAPVALPTLVLQSDEQICGAVIRDWLNVEREEQTAWPSAKEAFTAWREKIETRGVLVMQLRLGQDGLRGFSLEDAYAPLVAVNTAENLQARIFTLLHEVAHLASGTGASCLDGGGPAIDRSAERWCDRVASAAVIPRAVLLDELNSFAIHPEVTVEVVQQIAGVFSISLRATAVALIDAGAAEPELYAEIEERFPSSDYAKGFARGSPQRAPQRRLGEVGPRAASLVLEAVAEHRLSERDARQYLRLDGAELTELAGALGISS